MIRPTKFEGYFADEKGNIYSDFIKGGRGLRGEKRVMRAKLDKDGYLEYCFSVNGKRLYRRGHRVVWEAFNGDILDDLTIDHIDSDTANNSLSNLRLMSREENTSLATSLPVKVTLNGDTTFYKSCTEAIKHLPFGEAVFYRLKSNTYKGHLYKDYIIENATTSVSTIEKTCV